MLTRSAVFTKLPKKIPATWAYDVAEQKAIKINTQTITNKAFRNVPTAAPRTYHDGHDQDGGGQRPGRNVRIV